MKFRLAVAFVASLLAVTLQAQHKYPGNLAPIGGNSSNQPAPAQKDSAAPNAGMAPRPNSMQSNGTQAGAPAVSGSDNSVSTAATPTAPGERKLSYEIKVDGSKPWTDTGIQLFAGDRVTVTSTGSLD